MSFMEIYLKKMKYDIMNENVKKNNSLKLFLRSGKVTPSNPLMEYVTGENGNNSHIQTEVMISDLEDYEKYKTNGFQNQNKKFSPKNYTKSGLNSVTIDLDNTDNDNINKYGFHNAKIKTPHFKTINLTSNSSNNSEQVRQKKNIYKS